MFALFKGDFFSFRAQTSEIGLHVIEPQHRHIMPATMVKLRGVRNREEEVGRGCAALAPRIWPSPAAGERRFVETCGWLRAVGERPILPCWGAHLLPPQAANLKPPPRPNRGKSPRPYQIHRMAPVPLGRPPVEHVRPPLEHVHCPG